MLDYLEKNSENQEEQVHPSQAVQPRKHPLPKPSVHHVRSLGPINVSKVVKWPTLESIEMGYAI